MPFVERLEIVAAHVDLAAHLEHRRLDALQPQRNLADRTNVLRHVLAGLPVAARGRLHQHAALVTQADRQPVELQLARVLDRRVAVGQLELPANACIEIARAIFARIGLGADAEHWHRVAHRGEAREHRAADPLRRTVRRDQLGVRCLDRLQLLEQAVVLRVRDLRRVEHVIQVGMAVQLLAQLGSAARGAAMA